MLLTAALAGAAAAVVVGLPRPATVRLVALRPGAARGGQRVLLPPVAVLALLAGVLLAGAVPALLIASGTVVVHRLLAHRRRQRSEASQRAGCLEACDALAGELRAGRAPADALAAAAEVAAGPPREALNAAAVAARLGGDVPAALTGGRPDAAPALRSLAACWSVCSTSGAGLASAVEQLGAGLRAAQDQRRRVEAELAGPRATACLLALLPGGGLLLAAGLGADPLRVLLHTPLGLACLVLGLLLDAAGVLWTRRLVAQATRAL